MEQSLIEEISKAQQELEVKMNDYKKEEIQTQPAVPSYDFLNYANNEYFNYYPIRKTTISVIAKIKIPS